MEGSDSRPYVASLASFVAETTPKDVPAEARDTLVRAITDGVGVLLAGLGEESASITGNFQAVPTTGIPNGRGTDAERAGLALHLGTAMHALDYDDLSWAIDGHPTVSLLPAILALGDRSPSGAEVRTAYAVGFETASAIAEPISPDHYEAGWHATSTFGAIGAAASAAWLLDLDAKTTETALAIAASTPSGLKENFGSMTKPLHAGLAARSGITSATLAARGFTAGDRAFEGANGFWSLYRGDGDVDRSAIRPPAADDWSLATDGIHLKKYPTCYFTHSTIRTTRSMLAEHNVDPAAVESVTVTASAGAGDALAYHEPTTPLQSKFSMPHAVAVAMTADRVGIEWFETDALDEGTLVERRGLVSFGVDEALPYDSHAVTVEIDLGDEVISASGERPPWTAGAPPSWEALGEKFVSAASRTVAESAARRTFDRLRDLNGQDLTETLAAVRP